MARPPSKELTDREMEVMQVFWHWGESNATEIRDRLAASGLDLAYTTVATLVRILHEKGFLKQINEERPFRYVPAQSFEEVSGRLLSDVLQRVFGGSREQLLLCLVEQRKLNAKERLLLESLLKEEAS